MKSDPRPESPTNHLSRKADFASRVFIQCGEVPLNFRIWHPSPSQNYSAKQPQTSVVKHRLRCS